MSLKEISKSIPHTYKVTSGSFCSQCYKTEQEGKHFRYWALEGDPDKHVFCGIEKHFPEDCARCAIDRLIEKSENTDLVKKWKERGRIIMRNGPLGDYVSGRPSSYEECARELSEWLAVRGIR